MTEIVCAHKFGTWINTADSDGQPVRYKHCKWCESYVKDGDPEPRIVMARIE